ncbi:hypothetical protein ABID82_004674 [Methylobacterium sp. PvP062]|nr:hypothetical protein C7388_14326 [Methylobacterium organophilum]
MRSKRTPLSVDAQDDRPQGDIHDRPLQAGGLAKRRVLGRVAEALGMPLATLYDPPSATMLAADATSDLDHECEALLHAYKRISDPGRRRLLDLVQEVAERA